MKPPSFWKNSPKAPGLLSKILTPVSLLYNFATQKRLNATAQFRMGVPVICVGNVNLGGVGKTPTVIHIVQKLTDMGKKVCVISRGYGGNLNGPVIVDPLLHSANDVGDEPILLAGFSAVCVGKDRFLAAKLAVENGAEILVLDDGLQNPSLAYDLTVTVVDSEIGFGNERVFPAGPLREKIETAMARTDIVVAIGKNSKGLLELGKPIVSGTLAPLQMGMDWTGVNCLAFAGIGRPEKFFKTLEDQGANVKARHSFGDHQKLPDVILQRLEREAEASNLQMVTTEKDAARLPKAWQQKVLTLPVRLVFQDENPLNEKIEKLLG